MAETSRIDPLKGRKLRALASFALVLAASLALVAIAKASPVAGDGGAMSIIVSGEGDFNLFPPPYEDTDDPDYFFWNDFGSEGDAGLAMYVPELEQSYGFAGDSWFEPNLEDPSVVDTQDGKLFTSNYWVPDPEYGGDGKGALLDITEKILLSADTQTISLTYEVENTTDHSVKFRPYLLGAPYLLNASQAEGETPNMIKSAFSTAPAPTLSMSSTKANRTMTVISTGQTGDPKADSAQVYGYDSESGELGLDLLYYDVLEPSEGDSFAGPFETASLEDPGFGMEWSDWMSGTGLPSGQTARFTATLSLAKPTQGGPVGGVPVEGTIQFKPPGGGFESLKPGDEIPNKSIIDASDGIIQINSRGKDGSPQTAAFTGGEFQLLKTQQSLFTTMKLSGPLDCGAKSKQRSTDSTPQALRGKSGRSLWGSGKGKFRTQGKRGSGSVRGTTWKVTDNCDGSTKIQSLKGASEGKVDVTDFGKPRKKIVLNPGKSYLAKPKK